MKALKLIFIIGCIPLLLGDVFIVLNAAVAPVIPTPIVIASFALGLVGILAGILLFKPKKED